MPSFSILQLTRFIVLHLLFRNSIRVSYLFKIAFLFVSKKKNQSQTNVNMLKVVFDVYWAKINVQKVQLKLNEGRWVHS